MIFAKNSPQYLATASLLKAQRLGKNQGRYFGESIDIHRLLTEIEKAAGQNEWNSEVFYETDQFRWLALKRRALKPAHRLYLSCGIHGDEPAGPLAALEMLIENQWPDNVDIWLCPCLNPTGFNLNTRENADGLDLNRQYLNPKAGEIQAHIAWLEKQPRFDVCLCLHEDWESAGFYVYELNPDKRRSYAKSITASVSKVCPIDMSSMIEGRAASNGIIRPESDPRSRPQWPEAFYLFTHKTRLSYTLEAPSDFDLFTRVAAEVSGVRAVLDGLAASGK